MKCVDESADYSSYGLWLVDVQDKLFPYIDQNQALLVQLKKVLKIFEILEIKLVVSEQYPKGLGHTLSDLKNCFKENQKIFQKTSFSGLGDKNIFNEITSLPITNWILIGIETHICILQTAKDLLKIGKKVIILEDCVGARTPQLNKNGLNEMRHQDIRISQIETITYELIKDAVSPKFKKILNLLIPK